MQPSVTIIFVLHIFISILNSSFQTGYKTKSDINQQDFKIVYIISTHVKLQFVSPTLLRLQVYSFSLYP